MTSVGTLAGDLIRQNQPIKHTSAVSSSVSATHTDLPPSPSHSIPFIVASGADDDKATVPGPGDDSLQFTMQQTSKLDLEPNPFEQSFSGAGPDKAGGAASGGAGAVAGGAGASETGVETPKPILPSIASMSSRLAPGSDHLGWDAQSLRMGPLSPSMLQGPQQPIGFDQTTTHPMPIGSFPPSTSSISTVFASGPAAAENGVPFVAQTQGPQQPFGHSSYHPPQSMAQQPPGNGAGTRVYGPQDTNPNVRYMGPNQAQAPVDHINAYGNLHLLSQATHRDQWVKRENEPTGVHAHGPHPPVSQPSLPPSQPQAPVPKSQQGSAHPQQGQRIPGMPNMVMAHQLPKNGVEPAFVRGVRRSRIQSEDSSDSEQSKRSVSAEGGQSKKKQASGGDDKMDEEEKRRNFLERNRQAALKCRQRKKQWLSNLQAKVEYLSTDNEQLLSQTAALRDEIIHLKTLLLAHKDCATAQSNGVYVDTIGMPPAAGANGMIPPPQNRGGPSHPGPRIRGNGGNMQQSQQQQQPPYGPPMMHHGDQSQPQAPRTSATS